MTDIRPRLAKILALLDSPHAGEREAAGLLAAKMVREAGLTWAQVLKPAAGPDVSHSNWGWGIGVPPRPTAGPNVGAYFSFASLSNGVLKRVLRQLGEGAPLGPADSALLKSIRERAYQQPHQELMPYELSILDRIWNERFSYPRARSV